MYKKWVWQCRRPMRSQGVMVGEEKKTKQKAMANKEQATTGSYNAGGGVKFANPSVRATRTPAGQMYYQFIVVRIITKWRKQCSVVAFFTHDYINNNRKRPNSTLKKTVYQTVDIGARRRR